MKETVKIIAVLTVVCLLSSALLSYFSGITFARIEQNGIDAINDAIRVLAPQAVRNEEFSVSGLAVYRLFDAGDNNFGYAFIAQGQGYAGTIKMMVLTDMAISEINGMAVLESVETPGLGAKIKENSFRGQFVGLSVIP
ncbi:MAG: FMN-binding protein, partial [Candidatus Omnitrophica bacterium]|nr:FMN-binding protein [Candidatus Omnitrophota bacterium]